MLSTLGLAQSLGLVHILLIGIGCTLFCVLIGVCCPAWDEPYPRVVQYAYPSSSENRWFLMHVARTALRKEWYVSSISQFVSARGTTGSKLMLVLTSTVAISSVYIESVLWTQGRIPVSALVLTVIASIGLALLGFAESSIEWAPLPLDWPDLQLPIDTELMTLYYRQLEITRLTEAEDEQIKARFVDLHMIGAFTFVLAQFVARLVRDDRGVGFVVGCVGLVAFLFFCAMQWLSGANDALLESGGPLLARCAVSSWPRWCRVCYWPQDGSLSPRARKRISWAFIGVEVVAFASLASCPGWDALFVSVG